MESVRTLLRITRLAHKKSHLVIICKANILRKCIVDVVVNVKIIEELSLMKDGVLNSELSKSEVDELLQNICCE